MVKPPDLVYQITLEMIPGIGPVGVKHLISYCGSAEAVFSASRGKLLKIPGMGDHLVKTILGRHDFSEAEKILHTCNDLGIEVIPFTHLHYPDRLKTIPDNPNILYKKGEGSLQSKRSIAIVGTRKATNYGKDVTRNLVSDLKRYQATIISGLAYGIDIAAHKQALKEGLPTFGILAGGLDNIYPAAHRKYAHEMLENGGIVSESIPGAKPDAHLFPARNRIIAGLADAVVIVEAAEKGGALITAHIADSYNKPVFAVPGNIYNPYSRGTNKLIANQKALLINSVEELVYYLNWDKEVTDKADLPAVALTPDEQKIFDLLQKETDAVNIDLIAIKTQIPINQVASELLSLEFKGIVRSLPGKKYGIQQRD